MAVVPPYVPHEVVSEARHIIGVKVEADSTDRNALPAALKGRGAVRAPKFVRLARQRHHELSEQGAVLDLQGFDFDRAPFGATLAPRRVNRRLAAVLGRINPDLAAPFRSLLPYVNRAGNLAHVALDAGHDDPAGGWAEAERHLCRLAAPRGA